MQTMISAPPAGLKLVKAKSFSSGVMALIYEPAR